MVIHLTDLLVLYLGYLGFDSSVPSPRHPPRSLNFHIRGETHSCRSSAPYVSFTLGLLHSRFEKPRIVTESRDLQLLAFGSSGATSRKAKTRLVFFHLMSGKERNRLRLESKQIVWAEQTSDRAFPIDSLEYSIQAEGNITNAVLRLCKHLRWQVWSAVNNLEDYCVLWKAGRRSNESKTYEQIDSRQTIEERLLDFCLHSAANESCSWDMGSSTEISIC